MWVYVKTYGAKERWAVGYYEPGGVWRSISSHDREIDAARRVNYLNGGDGKTTVGFTGGND